ncbi:pilus assembly protein TadG-related protein [Candidatus Omnitrophota bacterium]
MALTNFKRVISLKNLSHKNDAGQIATFLMLIMVVILIFILVVVNIGQLSVTATQLSNAADAAALSMASQLSTRANYYRGLLKHQPEVEEGVEFRDYDPNHPWPAACSLQSFWDLIGAVIGIIVAIALMYAFPVLIPLGLLWISAGGLLGGGIGGGLSYNSWNGAAAGAAKGLALGLAVGGAMSLAGAFSTATFAGSAGGGAEFAAAGMESTSIFAGETIIMPATMVNSIMIGQLSAAILPGAVGMGTGLGTGAIRGSEINSEIRQYYGYIVKELSALPEYDQVRETAYFQALSRIVDDPNKTDPATFHYPCGPNRSEKYGGDPCDLDGDGDTQEATPKFMYWWKERIDKLKGVTADMKREIDDYVKEILGNSIYGGLLDGPPPVEPSFADWINGYGGEGLLDPLNWKLEEGPGGHVFVARLGWKMWWWKGSYFPELYAPLWWSADPTERNQLAMAKERIHGFIETAKGIVQRHKLNPWSVVGSYKSWLKFFYNWDYDSPNPPPRSQRSDLYALYYGASGSGFPYGIRMISSYLQQVTGVTQYRWPKGLYDRICYQDSPGGEYKNPPCRIKEQPIDGSSDADTEHEIFKVYEFMTKDVEPIVKNAVDRSKELYDNMLQLYRHAGFGDNFLEYSWTDSRGEHSVRVDTSDFLIANLNMENPYTHWPNTWYCFYEENHEDRKGQRTWVKVTRVDPAKKNAGILGLWNPHDPGGTGKLTISRTSRVAYGLYRYPLVGNPEYNPYVEIVDRR